MDWVLDASMALAWALPDDTSLQADRFFNRVAAGDGLWVPSLWWYEVANARRENLRSNAFEPVENVSRNGLVLLKEKLFVLDWNRPDVVDLPGYIIEIVENPVFSRQLRGSTKRLLFWHHVDFFFINGMLQAIQ